jgi:hypothetical protein
MLVIVHDRQVRHATAVHHLITTPAGPPLVATYGYGYQVVGHQLVYSLNLRNVGRAPTAGRVLDASSRWQRSWSVP